MGLHVTGPSGVLLDGVSAFSACRELRGVQIEAQIQGRSAMRFNFTPFMDIDSLDVYQ
jgi:hypothetical protein